MAEEEKVISTSISTSTSVETLNESSTSTATEVSNSGETSTETSNSTASKQVLSSTSWSPFGSFLQSAWNKTAETALQGAHFLSFATLPDDEALEDDDENDVNSNFKENAEESNLSSAFQRVSVLKEGLESFVSSASEIFKDPTSILRQFNEEQESFIQEKPIEDFLYECPWNIHALPERSAELREKILHLSEDRRNVLRAPPPGVSFDYEVSASVSKAILEQDSKLSQLRYECVPKLISEENFWKNYFYRVNLITQSFDYKVEPSSELESGICEEIDDLSDFSGDSEDDEFVSDAFVASSKDVDEASESLKKHFSSELEAAELENELQEFEIVKRTQEN